MSVVCSLASHAPLEQLLHAHHALQDMSSLPITPVLNCQQTPTQLVVRTVVHAYKLLILILFALIAWLDLYLPMDFVYYVPMLAVSAHSTKILFPTINQFALLAILDTT